MKKKVRIFIKKKKTLRKVVRNYRPVNQASLMRMIINQLYMFEKYTECY